MNTKRVAIVGIDGSGKSTVVRKLLELSRGEQAAVMTCPRYHEAPDAPLARVSRALEAFSCAADALRSFELKAAALYLQMTLYGPVERFFLDAFQPKYLLSERHALVDSLAYGPLYVQLCRRNADRATLETPLRERLGADYEIVLDWLARENRRLGLDVSLWNLSLHVRDLFARPGLATELARRYRTGLPDTVLLLDVSAEEAMRRMNGRSGSELHEKTALLERLRRSYRRALEQLDVEARVIDTSNGDEDDTLRAVLDHAGVLG